MFGLTSHFSPFSISLFWTSTQVSILQDTVSTLFDNVLAHTRGFLEMFSGIERRQSMYKFTSL